MARWAAVGPAAVDVRAVLLEHYRELIERYRATTGPWPLLVHRLEAGEPVTVRGWQLRGVRQAHGHPNRRYVVDRDGQLRPVRPEAVARG